MPLSALRSRYQALQGAFERALPASDPRPLDFYPPLLRLTDSPPNPIGRKVLWSLLILLAALLLWALIGRLDIVAVAEGSHAINAARSRAVNEGNVAAAQSVANIVDNRVRLGQPPREAIEQTRDLIGQHYDEALSGINAPAFYPEAALTQRMSTFTNDFPLMEKSQLRQINRYVSERVGNVARNSNGFLNGQQLKQIDSELGGQIRNLRSSTNAADKTAAPAWAELQQSLREVMEFVQASPQQSQQLKNANAAYRQLLAVEKSMLAGAESFTPRQLARQLDKAGIQGTDLNRVSDAMSATLPNTIPNSGTADRLLANSLPALLMGGGVGAQGMGYDTLGAGLIAAGALGSRPGAKAMTGGYQLQQQQLLIDALRKGTAAGIRGQGNDE